MCSDLMSVSSFARASITCVREGQGQGEKWVKKEGPGKFLKVLLCTLSACLEDDLYL